MASTKLIFHGDEVERLRTKIGQVSQDTNQLYMQLRGQASNWGGIPLGQTLVQAQVLINELTVEAEKLENLLRTAVRGVQGVQDENQRQAGQWGRQFSLFGGLFGSLGAGGAAGWFSIPASAQKAATNLISSVATLTGRDELNSDSQVQKLRDIIQKSGLGTVAGITAQSKLKEICEARDQIAKAQTAYKVYQAFGNQAQMEAVHKLADEARKKLESLGVDEVQYQAGKDLSAYFKQPAVKACDYDPSITTGSVPLIKDESYLLLLRMAMEPGNQGDWAKSQLTGKRLEIKLAEAAKIIAAQIEAEKRLKGPPMELPDGTPITAKNKENETTFNYFKTHVSDPTETNQALAYYVWLEETYGMTEWRKRVVQADAVTSAFVGAIIEETVMGIVDTAKLAFNFVVDPQKTTQEMVDQASYLVNHPEALMEAAKMVYHNFDEGTPEEKAAMLGSVASLLVPGLSITKSGKVAKVVDGVQDVATKAMDGVKDLGKVLQNAEHFTGFPNLNPFLNTPEGFTFNVGKITPDTNPLPKTSVQEHYLNEMDGLGDVKAGKVEGKGKLDITESTLPKGGKPKGKYEKPDSNDPNPINFQNKAADLLASEGFDIEMLPNTKGGNGYGINPTSNPDFLINGKVFDCYSPETLKVRNIWATVVKKTEEQANRIVMNLDGYKGSMDALFEQFNIYEIPSLEELIIIRDGQITRLKP